MTDKELEGIIEKDIPEHGYICVACCEPHPSGVEALECALRCFERNRKYNMDKLHELAEKIQELLDKGIGYSSEAIRLGHIVLKVGEALKTEE